MAVKIKPNLLFRAMHKTEVEANRKGIWIGHLVLERLKGQGLFSEGCAWTNLPWNKDRLRKLRFDNFNNPKR